MGLGLRPRPLTTTTLLCIIKGNEMQGGGEAGLGQSPVASLSEAEHEEGGGLGTPTPSLNFTEKKCMSLLEI